MKLLEEIIDLAASDNGSVATLLRKCLVLAHRLKNDRLKTWAEKELNGYERDDEVPEYRKTAIGAKGFFVGAFGAQINNQPIPPAVLKKEHRRFAESVVLFQPIASYDDVDGNSKFVIEWPPNLTLLYQSSFFEGYNLNRAWQEIPGSVIRGLIDTIRTRILRFALELKDDLGMVGDDPAELPRERIDQIVVNYIFGGTTVIASKEFTQINTIEIDKGDWTALAEVLDKRLGVATPEISKLKSALDQDSKDAPTPGLGRRTMDWMKQLGKKSGELALTVGVDVAKKEATNLILQYLGHHGH
jgi:AbiTii